MKCECEICESKREKINSVRLLGFQVGSGSRREEALLHLFFQIFMMTFGVIAGIKITFALMGYPE